MPHSLTVQGLGSVIYNVRDLVRAKAWYEQAFGQAPYFDSPGYVGFNIAGYELGLYPNPKGAPGPGGHLAYWRVADISAGLEHFTKVGATLIEGPQDVGEGIKMATVSDPFGNEIGLIENPHFKL